MKLYSSVKSFLKWIAASREKTYCSIYGFDGGTRPSCPPVARRKWDHEFDGRRGQREMGLGLLSFLPSVPVVFNTDVQPRTQHGNVTFAFQRYLHWSCVYLSLAAEKEARQQTHTGRSESIQISIRDTGPSFLEGGLDCHRRKVWQVELQFTGQSRRFVSLWTCLLRKYLSFRLPQLQQQQRVEWLIDFLLSRSSLSPAVTFCREAAVTEMRKSMQTLVEVTQTVSQATVNIRRIIIRCLWHHVGLYNNFLLLISLISFLMRIMVCKAAYLLLPCLKTHFIIYSTVMGFFGIYEAFVLILTSPTRSLCPHHWWLLFRNLIVFIFSESASHHPCNTVTMSISRPKI